MLDAASHRHAVATTIGSVLVPIALALDGVAPEYVGLAVVVPVLLGLGVLEIYGRYWNSSTSAGRAGVILTGAGLALLLIAILLYAVTPPVFYAVFLVAIAGVPALAALGLGSAFLAVALSRLDLISVPTAVLLGVGVPLWPALTVLAGGVDAGAVFGPTVTAGVLSALAGAPYGLGRTLVGFFGFSNPYIRRLEALYPQLSTTNHKFRGVTRRVRLCSDRPCTPTLSRPDR